MTIRLLGDEPRPNERISSTVPAIGFARRSCVRHSSLLGPSDGGIGCQPWREVAFDEKLKRYADMRSTLHRNGAARVNYGKFSEVLDEVKTIRGTKKED